MGAHAGGISELSLIQHAGRERDAIVEPTDNN